MRKAARPAGVIRYVPAVLPRSIQPFGSMFTMVRWPVGSRALSVSSRPARSFCNASRSELVGRWLARAGIYFLAFSPISTSRRIASLRETSCSAAHASIWDVSSVGRRIALTGSRPVAGRPAPGLAPPCVFGIAFFIRCNTKFKLAKQAARPRPQSSRRGRGPLQQWGGLLFGGGANILTSACKHPRAPG